MNLSGLIIIAIISYLMGEILKKIFSKKLNKYIPLILTLLGGILGVVIYLTNREIMLNISNVYESLVVGLLCGNSSTGANQILKQLLKKEVKDEESIL